MSKSIVKGTENIFEQGNLHMQTKLRFFGGQGATVIKYIIAKLRKYRGEFFESNATIAEACGCSVRTVQNAVKRAEELEIFIVSSRTEMTFNGKFRQTSNKIQLLAYAAVEVVKEVIETVRTVASKVVKKAKKAVKKSANAPKKKPYNKKPIRTEMLPGWITDGNVKEYVSSPPSQTDLERILKIKERFSQKCT